MSDSSPKSGSPVVMKFGGSSVADLDRIRTVAKIVVARAQQQPVVVVVSAMAGTTDRLVAEAKALSQNPPARELDMLLTTGERHSMALLALAVHEQGAKAMSLTGSQCGIITDHQHGRARIVEVRPFRILDELSAGYVVIVGGFQGVSYKREVTTLGRGGSDTTAVAVAAALGADCEIYSDVDGVYSSDPRQVPNAERIDQLAYAEMQALSRAGAKVLHAQAVELAQERGIAIYARSTKDAAAGQNGGQTVVRNNPNGKAGVRAVVGDAAVVEIAIDLGPGTTGETRQRLAEQLGDLGLRYFSVDDHGARGIVSATQRDDADRVSARVGEIVQQLLEADTVVDRVAHRADHGLVSCVGAGLEERADLYERALACFAQAKVDVAGVRSDGHSLAFLVPRAAVQDMTRSLHRCFLEA